MFQRNREIEAIVDFINLALGGFLVLSPWLFGFRSQLGWHTSWMAGAAISIVSIFSIADLFDSVSIPAFFESEEWINLTIGSWLAICPWVLNFNDDTLAMQVHLVVGIVVATVAAVELWAMHHRPAKKALDTASLNSKTGRNCKQ